MSSRFEPPRKGRTGEFRVGATHGETTCGDCFLRLPAPAEFLGTRFIVRRQARDPSMPAHRGSLKRSCWEYAFAGLTG